MTELDPRFDARFQRGYVPGPGEDRRADASAGTPTAERAVVAPTDRIPSAEPEAERDASAVGTGVAEQDAAIESAEARRTSLSWLAGAFGFCALLVLFGAWWLWVGVADETNFRGPFFQNPWSELRWWLAPALLEVGASGAVLLAVALGLLRARRGVRLRANPFVVGLGAAVLAAAGLVVWAGAGATSQLSGDPGLWSDAQRLDAALAQLRPYLATPAVRAGALAVLGILVIGAASAIASRAEPAEPPAAPASAGDADGERGGVDPEVR